MATSFEVRLKEPFARLIDGFARMTAYPLFVMAGSGSPGRLLRPSSRSSSARGPFKLLPDEWVPGVKFVVAKHAGYKPRSEAPSGLAGGKIAGVDRIERIQFSDDLSAVNALLAGEIDYVAEVPAEMLPVLEKDKSIQVAKAPILGKNFQVVINHTQPPMDNVKGQAGPAIRDQPVGFDASRLRRPQGPLPALPGAVHVRQPLRDRCRQRALHEAGLREGEGPAEGSRL
jgi:peptide/nickel transport system substrate-binding protein